MQSPVVMVMMSDIKALLTLWLLKTGTTPAEIRTSLQLAAASRAMAGDDQTTARPDTAQRSTASNIARLHPNSDAEIAGRKAQLLVEAMSADVMTLVTLSLLKVGTSSDEIQKALRLAALARASTKDENPKGSPSDPDPLGGAASMAPKQAALDELLVPHLGHG